MWFRCSVMMKETWNRAKLVGGARHHDGMHTVLFGKRHYLWAEDTIHIISGKPLIKPALNRTAGE